MVGESITGRSGRWLAPIAAAGLLMLTYATGPAMLGAFARKGITVTPEEFSAWRGAAKRGAGEPAVPLDEALIGGERPDALIELSDALDTLAAVDIRKARVIELTYFAGLTQQEIATVLEVHVNTVARERRVAEARLMWWSDEASYWLQGHPRHPLALGLDAAAAAAALAQLVHLTHAWMETPPDGVSALRDRLHALSAAGASLGAPPGAGAPPIAWYALAVRLALAGAQSGASLLPLDLCARHGLRRSQWAELEPSRRRTLLAEVVPAILGPGQARGAAAGALEALEQRWLARLEHGADERLRLLDVFAAWRAARRAR